MKGSELMDELQEIFAKFPGDAQITFRVYWFSNNEKLYKCGWKYKGIHYIPGSGSYYPLEEAVQRAWDAFQEDMDRGAFK